MDNARYWIKCGVDKWHEVTKDEFIAAERRAGFHAKGGGGLATGGFSSTMSNTRGRITYGEITEDQYGWDAQFMNDAKAHMKGGK